jgi:hypothetical protein
MILSFGVFRWIFALNVLWFLESFKKEKFGFVEGRVKNEIKENFRAKIVRGENLEMFVKMERESRIICSWFFLGEREGKLLKEVGKSV